MELDSIDLKEQCVFVKFHSLSSNGGRDTLNVMSGNSILQVVSGKDITIQHMMDKTSYIDDESKLNEIVTKYTNHKWAEHFIICYKIMTLLSNNF